MTEEEPKLPADSLIPGTEWIPSEQQPTQAQTRRIRVTYEYQGSLPPPEMLAGYEKVFPGCAERIVAMTERQGHHRQQTETTIVGASVASEKRGSNYGLVIALVALIGSFILIDHDKIVPGLIVFFGDIGGIVSVFVLGRHTRRDVPDNGNGEDEEHNKSSSDAPS